MRSDYHKNTVPMHAQDFLDGMQWIADNDPYEENDYILWAWGTASCIINGVFSNTSSDFDCVEIFDERNPEPQWIEEHFMRLANEYADYAGLDGTWIDDDVYDYFWNDDLIARVDNRYQEMIFYSSNTGKKKIILRIPDPILL